MSILNLPQHVAIIMDGNGRWALLQGRARSEGHLVGLEVAQDIIIASIELGINYLTLYAFSQENWQRPEQEVSGLMSLFQKSLSDTGFLSAHRIKIKFIGDLSQLPRELVEQILLIENLTKGHEGLFLTIALSYSARKEILAAANLGPHSNEEAFAQRLSTHHLPYPDLLIRSGGHRRLSNFLLWQIAYTELYFSDTLWPAFTVDEFKEIIKYYCTRQRNYGKITMIT